MKLFCCFKPREVEKKSNEDVLVTKPTLSVEYDKHGRKIETRTYLHQDVFVPMGLNIIRETFVYSLNDADADFEPYVVLWIRMYDRGCFVINRYDYTVDSYVIIDEDNPMNCSFTRFLDNLNHKSNSVDYSITNERWMKEMQNRGECPDYGFKIVMSKHGKNVTYEIGRYIY